MDLFRTLFAHDIYNIFNNIKLASELCNPYLNDPSKLDELKDMHQIIEEQINRGDKLIKNVQKLTTLEDTKFPLRRENLRQIINNSIEFLNNSFHIFTNPAPLQKRHLTMIMVLIQQVMLSG